MAELPLFVQLRWRLVRNLWRSIAARHSAARIAAVGLMLAVLWSCLFALFYWTFSWINANSSEFFVVAVNLLMALLFLIMFGLLTLANGLLCFGAFFRGWESASLMSRPVRPPHVFWHMVTEAAIYSLWGMALLCLPLLVALGASAGARPAYYAVAAALLVLFVLLSVGVGAGLALLFSRFALPSRRKIALVVLAASLAFAALGLGDVARRAWLSDQHDIATWLQGPLAKLNIAQNPFLPSLWLSRGLTHAASGQWRPAGFYLGLLASNVLLVGMVGHLLAARCYEHAYHCAQDTRSFFRPSPRRLLYRAAEALSFPLSPAQRMIVLKDLKAFFRTPTQWGQMAIFSGVLLVYFVNIWYFQDNSETGLKIGTRSLVNLVATLLTLTTFTVRFSFPSISLEGRNLWVLGLLPSERREILEAKFFASFAGSLVFGVPLVLASHWALNSMRNLILLHMVTLVLVCAGLSALAVGLGALYPSTEQDDHSKSAAGFGGTLNLVFSVAFVAFVVIGLVIPNQFESQLAPLSFLGEHARSIPSLAVALGTVFLCGVMLWRGGRALDRMEM